jgi:hypothetical protein
MLANIQNYSDRIAAGKQVEKSILDALRQKGYKIKDPSTGEDKYDKIDGWWIGTKGTPYSVQVKFRQSGDDILFELTKDIDKNIPGRDLISKAMVYLVADRSGTTRMFLTKPIKEKGQQILNTIQQDLQKEPNKTNWGGNGWEAKVQVDRAGGQRKIVAYFSPRMFEALATWQLNIH